MFIWKIFGKLFCTLTVFTLRAYFSYTVDTGGGDGAANFAQLDSDYSEPGKHVWTLDMMSVCCSLHFCIVMACLWTPLCMIYLMHIIGKYVSESIMLLDTYLQSHVLVWGWVRWQCCDMPGLCQIIWLPCRHDTIHIHIHSILYYHMFSERNMA